MKNKVVRISKTPMRISYECHGGQASPLYAYSCTGHIDPCLLMEIRECWNLKTTTSKDRIELAYLWCTVNHNLTIDDMSANIYWHRTLKNADGTQLRVRKTGILKTWKTRPGEFKLPVKHGLYYSTYITHENCHEWCLPIE